MSLKSITGGLSPKVSLVPALRTATAAGSAVDTLGANSIMAVFAAGAWTDGTHALSITECDTSGGDYTAVEAGRIVGTLTSVTSAGTASNVQIVGLVGKVKRYLKANVTVTGSPGTGAIVGGSFILGDLNKV